MADTLPARPVAGPPTIGVSGELDILLELLAIERERLTVARCIEEQRKIVFPETSVIVRDIERLLGKVRAMETTTLARAYRDPLAGIALADAELLDGLMERGLPDG